MAQLNGFDITIGADPEVFVKSGNFFVSAHAMIPGTKKAPHKVEDGAVQVDGMALEYNIDPCLTEEQFVARNKSVLAKLGTMIPAGHKIVIQPTAHFSKTMMAKQPPEALELGCEPDYNAYTGEANPRPNADDVLFRTGAGHIHIGWGEGFDIEDPEHFELCRMIARQMDAYLGCPSLSWDNDAERRKLYGCAGAFRPKPYGLEYRTMSNAWVGDEKLMAIVYRNCIKGLTKMADGKYVGHEKWAEGENCHLRDAINSNHPVVWRAISDFVGAEYVR